MSPPAPAGRTRRRHLAGSRIHKQATRTLQKDGTPVLIYYAMTAIVFGGALLVMRYFPNFPAPVLVGSALAAFALIFSLGLGDMLTWPEKLIRVAIMAAIGVCLGCLIPEPQPPH